MVDGKVKALMEQLFNTVKESKNLRLVLMVRDVKDGHTGELVLGDTPTILDMISSVSSKVLKEAIEEGNGCDGDCDYCKDETKERLHKGLDKFQTESGQTPPYKEKHKLN